MSTPVATIADALIAFILSLLRDPAAVEEFDAAPQAVLASNGLADACLDDVKAVAPVVIDHPSVSPSPGGHGYKPSNDDPVIKEISKIVHQFTTTIDNRTTIVDQSVNQNIWTNGGDVTQVFDQEAIVASGDGSIAAGENATLDKSETDVTIGDVAIGNTSTENNVTDSVDGSLNEDSSTTDNSDNSVNVDASSDDSFRDESDNYDVSYDDSFNTLQDAETGGENDAELSAVVEEPYLEPAEEE